MSLHQRHKIRTDAAHDLKEYLKKWQAKYSGITHSEVMTILGAELYDLAKSLRNKEHDTPGQTYVE